MKKSRWKKSFGVLLIVLGLLALITPFTPGSWLIFIGLEFFGFRFFFKKRLHTLKQKIWSSPPKETGAPTDESTLS